MGIEPAMSGLRPDVSIALLNEQGDEYLPGYLGIEMLERRRVDQAKRIHLYADGWNRFACSTLQSEF